MCFCWLSFSMGYFGLMYNMPARQGSVYLVYIMPSIFHIVTLPLYPYFQVQCTHSVRPLLPYSIIGTVKTFQTKFGRKAILTIPLLFGGVVMLCTMAVPKEKTTGKCQGKQALKTTAPGH